MTNLTNDNFTSIHPSIDCLERIQKFFLEQPLDKFIDFDTTINNLKDLNYLTSDEVALKIVVRFVLDLLGAKKVFNSDEDPLMEFKHYVAGRIKFIIKIIKKEKRDKFIKDTEKSAEELGLTVKFKVNVNDE